jgi:isocitrate dehydrogenase (NAD+)
MNIAEYAFQYAVKNNRKTVTVAHKAGIMKKGDGLFVDCCSEVAAKYPQINLV